MTDRLRDNLKKKLLLEFRSLEKDNSWADFYTIIRNSAISSTLNYSVEEAKKVANKPLNRYKDVSPFDHSRVVLRKDGYNYINANYVNVDSINRKYILTQGPLLSTVSHFWLMVWEQKSKAVVMLNNLVEKNQAKCAKYWPETEDGPLNLKDIGVGIVFVSQHDCGHYTVRHFKLVDLNTNEERPVSQFHYTAWPDFGVPKNPTVFLHFLHAVRRSGGLSSESGPAVIHCSAGIGRSGTFCLVDSYLAMVDAAKDDCSMASSDICSLLLDMRKYRIGLIQTHEQLRFSYMAIIHGLKFTSHSEQIPVNSGYEAAEQENLFNLCSEQDEEDSLQPPPPPPRARHQLLEKPLPNIPLDATSSSSSSSSSPSDDSDESDSISEEGGEERKTLKSVDARMQLTVDGDYTLVGEGSRKRKRSEKEIEEAAKKQLQDESEHCGNFRDSSIDTKEEEEEENTKNRSILKYVGIGLGFIAVCGAYLSVVVYKKLTSTAT